VSPYEQIEAVYNAHPQELPFWRYVDYHHRRGYVYSNQDYFVMGRPVIKESTQDLIADPTHAFPKELCNCWFVHAMAGNIGKALEIMPWPLGWIGFERLRAGVKDLTFLPTEDLCRLSRSSPDAARQLIS
jgi:hypothetical protein